MPTTYAKHFSTRATPQSEPVPGTPQVANSAGGYSFAVDDWTRLERFLILGNEGGSYYASEKALTVENARCVQRCLAADAARTVETIAAVSESGRAPKNDPAVFALAICSAHPAALAALPRVCRIGAHLFQFIDQARAFRGRGRAFNRAVAAWYLDRKPRDLAYQVTKYQQRGGWSHRDVLRLVKPKAEGPTGTIMRWAVGKQTESAMLGVDSLAPVLGYEKAKVATTAKETARLIREFRLVRECVPTERLNSPEVWEALLEEMPMHALLRNLGKMSNVGLVKPMSNAAGEIVRRFEDKDAVRKSRLHPLAILLAQRTYAAGKGQKGSLTWTPDNQIVDALEDAFYAAFDNATPTGKRHLLAIDVSGSMGGGSVAGTSLTPREASAAMALVTVRAEPKTHTMMFATTFQAADLGKTTALRDAVKKLSRANFGGTDCALPMLYALQHKIEADVFVVYTDSETWFGGIHPVQALRQYREKMGIPAKLIVVGMVRNGFTIADPADAGMMDVVGFDAAAPAVMADFAR